MAQSKTDFAILERKYALNILKEISMLGCKLVDTSMDANVKLVHGQGEPLKDLCGCQRLVGSIFS